MQTIITNDEQTIRNWSNIQNTVNVEGESHEPGVRNPLSLSNFVVEMEIKPVEHNMCFRTGRVVDIEIQSRGESRIHDDLDDFEFENREKTKSIKKVNTGIINTEVKEALAS